MFQIEIPGFTPGVTQAHEKCEMKIKERKKKEKQRLHKNFFDNRKDFVRLLLKLDITNVNELQDNKSSHTKGTTYLSSKRVNGHQKHGFSSVGAQMGTIKLAMAGT